MASELFKRLVWLEEKKQIRDGITRKLATALVRSMEAAVGDPPLDLDEIVSLHYFSTPPALQQEPPHQKD